VTEMKSILEGSSDDIRRQISEQRTDAEIAQGALTMLLCDHYDAMLEVLGGQIDVNTSDIADLKYKVSQMSGSSSQVPRHRQRPAFEPINPEKKKRIEKLIQGSTVTPIGLTDSSSDVDEFEKLDQMAASGKIDPDGMTTN